MLYYFWKRATVINQLCSIIKCRGVNIIYFLNCFTYPRFHQEPLLPFAQREKGGSEQEHERQKGHIIVLLLFYYCFIFLWLDVTWSLPFLSRFSRSAQHREPGEQIKAFLKISKKLPLHFSFPFNLNGTNGWWTRGKREKGEEGDQGEGNDNKGS